MKPNRPSLILYFTACLLVVFFKLLGYESYVVYAKSVIIPLVFIYYFITNNYKISTSKAFIFLFCFIGDIINIINFDISHLLSLLSFLVAYLLLLKLTYDDFKSLKFNERDRIPILISLLFIVAICSSVLSLQFENMVFNLSLYIIYGIVLGIFIFISVTNYIKKPNIAFLNLVVFCVCSMISDTFFMINKFYLSLFALDFLQASIQVFSYYFMVTYFIANDKYLMKQNGDEF
jgi:uncharacterized membrane protein YhhN